MKPLKVKAQVGSDTLTLDVGKVFREDQLPPSLEDTILDPVILKEGSELELPFQMYDIFGRNIRKLYLPPLSPDGRFERSGGLCFIHRISVAFNDILSVIAESPIKAEALQKVVDLYFRELLIRVLGHSGAIAKSIIGTRMARSGRLVLLPQIERSPEWVGICSHCMKHAEVEEGDLVIVFRDPVIWTGSLEVMKAYPIQDEVIRLHPLLFEQLGADCDGDQVAFAKPRTEDAGVLAELESNLISFCRANAKWPKRLCPNGLGSDVDWANIMEDTQKRFRPTGLSYGPRDVSGWRRVPDSVAKLELLAGKEFGEKNKTISHLDINNAWSIIEQTNDANVFMKRNMGIVGATARRIMLVAGEDPWVCEAASLVSNIIQQKTLDAKHHVGEEASTAPADIMMLFERRGKWASTSLENCIALLVKAEVPEEAARKVLLYFRVEIPVRLMVETNLTNETHRAEIVETLREILHGADGKGELKPDLKPVMAKIAHALSIEMKGNVSPEMVQAECMRFKLGITNMMRFFYPGFALTNVKVRRNSPSVKRRLEVALDSFREVVHKRVPDRGSVFAHTFPSLEANIEGGESDDS